MGGERRYTSGMRTAGVIAVLATALLLTGCASGAAQTDGSGAAVAQSAAPDTMDATAAPEPDSTGTSEIDEATFLRGAKAAWRGDVPSDEELIAAGRLACDQLAAGTTADAVRVVVGDGDDADWNNQKLVTYGAQTYCPEFL